MMLSPEVSGASFSETLLQRIRDCGVIAVLVIEDPQRAVKLAQSLLAGGVCAMELTLRTPAALECLRAITTEVPDMLAGAGTVILPQQVTEVQQAGASFAVSPGTNPEVIAAAAAVGLPFAPGVMTPSDIDAAVRAGCRSLKFFPAVPAGGLSMLSSLQAPYAHLGVNYIPLGGVSEGNLVDWLKHPGVPAVGGSWLAPKKLIDTGKWDEIQELASRAASIVQSIRSTHPQV